MTQSMRCEGRLLSDIFKKAPKNEADLAFICLWTLPSPGLKEHRKSSVASLSKKDSGPLMASRTHSTSTGFPVSIFLLLK